MHQFASVPAGKINPSTLPPNIFASTPGSSPTDYLPKIYQEKVIYDALWAAANPDGAESLGGASAVGFFQKSGVDTGILRQVIDLVDYNAHEIRLIYK